MTDQEIADIQSRLTEAQATIERAQEWRAMSEHEYEQLERHANELELSNSRQGAEILRLQACCAEMRPLVQMLGWYGNGPDMDKFYHCPLCKAYGEDSDTLPHTPTCKIGHALSADCGKGWMPPEERQNLQERICGLEGVNAGFEATIRELRERNKRLVDFLGQASGCLSKEDYPHLLKAIEQILAAETKP